MGKAEDRTGFTQVELSKDEWDKRAEALASEEAARIALIEKKRTHNRAWNEELIQRRERIAQLTEEVETHTAWVPAQTDMFGETANDADADEEPGEEAPRRRRRGRRAAGAEAVEVASDIA